MVHMVRERRDASALSRMLLPQSKGARRKTLTLLIKQRLLTRLWVDDRFPEERLVIVSSAVVSLVREFYPDAGPMSVADIIEGDPGHRLILFECDDEESLNWAMVETPGEEIIRLVKPASIVKARTGLIEYRTLKHGENDKALHQARVAHAAERRRLHGLNRLLWG